MLSEAVWQTPHSPSPPKLDYAGNDGSSSLPTMVLCKRDPMCRKHLVEERLPEPPSRSDRAVFVKVDLAGLRKLLGRIYGTLDPFRAVREPLSESRDRY